MIKRALLTGVGDKYRLSNNKFAPLNLEKDLERISTRLKEANWNSIEHIDDKSIKPPTKENIKISIYDITNNIEGTDIFLFYFSGHGFKFINEYYLINYDEAYFEADSTNYYQNQEGLISNDDYLSFVSSVLTIHPNLIFISVIDCCYAGGMVLNLIKDDFPDKKRHIAFCSVFPTREAETFEDDMSSKFTNELCNSTKKVIYKELKKSLETIIPKPFISVTDNFFTTTIDF